MRPVELTWSGGEHPFLLTIPLLRALQNTCDAGPMHILGRLQSGMWLVDDVLETIRLGLEGGGAEKETARTLVSRHVDGNLAANVLIAITVLRLSIYGDFETDDGDEGDNGDDDPGEA